MSSTKRLGRFDRKGIDCFHLDDELQNIRIAIQCKGFENLDFEQSQQDQCLTEINKYIRLGPWTEEYWFVINRSVKGHHRQELLCELDKLAKTGKAKGVKLLDFDHFYDKLEELSSKLVDRWMTDLRDRQFEYYSANLNFADHVENVPFNQAGATHFGPVTAILNQFEQYCRQVPRDQTAKFRRHPKIVLTGTFGFGKTMTLHVLASKWIKSGGKVIYMPAALIGSSGFSNTSSLVESMLGVMSPDDFECSKWVSTLLRDCLRKQSETSTRILLFIDGLDEHPTFLKPRTISTLWHSLQDLGLPCVVTVRDELYDARELDFDVSVTNPLIRNAPPFERVRLLDWTNDNILDFLNLFTQRKDKAESGELSKLYDAIKTNTFEFEYGDIPKRPLFLGMLAEDAWEGMIPANNLSTLYENYFFRKFKRDVSGTVAGAHMIRSNDIIERYGIEETFLRLMSAMTEFARLLSRVIDESGSKHLVLEEVGSADELDRILLKYGLDHVPRESVFLHALLQPAGRHPYTRKARVRFCHQSFHEWFAARALYESCIDADLVLPPAVSDFLKSLKLVQETT